MGAKFEDRPLRHSGGLKHGIVAMFGLYPSFFDQCPLYHVNPKGRW